MKTTKKKLNKQRKNIGKNGMKITKKKSGNTINNATKTIKKE